MRILHAATAGLLALPLTLAGVGCDGSAPDTPSDATAGAGPALVVVDPQFPETPEEIDLGSIDMGDVVTRSVRLRNTTDGPLVIRSVRPGCSCTLPRLSYVDPASGETVVGDTRGPGDVLSLPAGVTAELEFRVDSALAPARNRHKLVVVRLVTDSPVTPYLTLNLRLFVVSHFRPAPAVIDLREVAEHGGASGEVTLAQDGEEGRLITGVLRSPLELVPELTHDTSLGVDLWVLRARLLPPVPLGYHEYEIELSSSGPGGQGEGQPVVVQVHVTGVPDARLEPPFRRFLAQAISSAP